MNLGELNKINFQIFFPNLDRFKGKKFAKDMNVPSKLACKTRNCWLSRVVFGQCKSKFLHVRWTEVVWKKIRDKICSLQRKLKIMFFA